MFAQTIALLSNCSSELGRFTDDDLQKIKRFSRTVEAKEIVQLFPKLIY